jgi:hypothetical protein
VDLRVVVDHAECVLAPDLGACVAGGRLGRRVRRPLAAVVDRSAVGRGCGVGGLGRVLRVRVVDVDLAGLDRPDPLRGVDLGVDDLGAMRVRVAGVRRAEEVARLWVDRTVADLGPDLLVGRVLARVQRLGLRLGRGRSPVP